jgi:hypothetical protein
MKRMVMFIRIFLYWKINNRKYGPVSIREMWNWSKYFKIL